MTRQGPGERNFHVLHYLLAGAPDDLRATLQLSDSEYYYIDEPIRRDPAVRSFLCLSYPCLLLTKTSGCVFPERGGVDGTDGGVPQRGLHGRRD